jgi:hypothetical protein
MFCMFGIETTSLANQAATIERTRLTLRFNLRSVRRWLSATSISRTALLKAPISRGFDLPSNWFCFSTSQASKIQGEFSNISLPSQLDLRTGQSFHFTKYQTNPFFETISAIIFSGLGIVFQLRVAVIF